MLPRQWAQEPHGKRGRANSMVRSASGRWSLLSIATLGNDLKPTAKPECDVNEPNQGRHLDQRSDDGGERHARAEAED
jgi:hypothetical protein